VSRFSSIIREDTDQVVSEMHEALRPLAGTTFLVTGAAGFLCSYFLDVIAALNRKGRHAPCRVIALDNGRTGLADRTAHLAEDPNFNFVSCDVSQPFDLGERVDWIIHGASIASPTFYRRFPLETIDVNVSGTRQMLELSRQRGARSMLYLSSSEIYGDPESAAIPTPEEYRGHVSCTGPRACYDESKRLGETLCVSYYRLYRTPVKIVRPFNVYGPGQRLDDRRIIPDLMAAAIKKQAIVLYSDGTATRAFCYIRDFVRGALYVLMSRADGEAFNVGNDEEVSIRTLAELVADIAAPPRSSVDYRSSGDRDYLTDNPLRRCPDLRKLRSLVAYNPEINIREGLTRTLRSYREIAAMEAV
jgi:dTDP-glucose 4,6-dehydratase/UDP-glucuronate decarboxylase